MGNYFNNQKNRCISSLRLGEWDKTCCYRSQTVTDHEWKKWLTAGYVLNMQWSDVLIRRLPATVERGNVARSTHSRSAAPEVTSRGRWRASATSGTERTTTVQLVCRRSCFFSCRCWLPTQAAVAGYGFHRRLSVCLFYRMISQKPMQLG